jgi:hypothetical protein
MRPGKLACRTILGAILLYVTSAQSLGYGPHTVNVSYALSNDSLTLHEPVTLKFSVANYLTEPIHLELGADRRQAFLFTIVRPDGITIHPPQHQPYGAYALGSIIVQPGQTYSQELILDMWYEFNAPGNYRIEGRLVNPILTESNNRVEADLQFQATLNIGPRDTSRLNQLCAELARRIGEGKGYEEAAEPALDLSYVRDPIAVPYLSEAIRGGNLVESILIPGLERIGNDDAVEALISTLDLPKPDIVTIAHGALEQIEHRTPDPALRRKIELALRAPTG